VRTYLKKTALVPPELDGATASTGFSVLRPSRLLDPKYLFYRVTADDFVASLSAHQTGSSYPAVRDSDVRAETIQLPPLAEQRRIVAAIEEQFSRLDASDGQLARAERLLHILREAAIEAAMAGGWTAVRVEEAGDSTRNALAIGPFGSNLKVNDYRDSGVPLIFVRNIRSGRFDGPNTRFVTPEKAAELGAHAVQPGDVLVTKMGDPPGDTVVYPAERQPAILTADCIKITPSAAFDSAFLAYAIAAKPARRQILMITKGVAQKKVSLARFKAITVPAPPLEEQLRIVAEIEQQLSLIDALRAAVESAQKRSEALRRAILERAFRGELVPQDPDDAPASVLLERIRGERASAPRPKRRKRATV
jgi:type I restriction enzyme S subunit